MLPLLGSTAGASEGPAREVKSRRTSTGAAFLISGYQDWSTFAGCPKELTVIWLI